MTGDAVTVNAKERIRALEIITRRNDLTEAEENTRRRQIRLSEAEHELARGKYFLARENYGEAGKHYAKADELEPHTKVENRRLLCLRIAPRLTLRVFKKFRAAEVAATL